LRLTTGQRQIVRLLAEGNSSKEVAAELNISVETADTHRANIMRRLDCHSAAAPATPFATTSSKPERSSLNVFSAAT
jgi:DNA-binding CsgD family transcriptional regulator